MMDFSFDTLVNLLTLVLGGGSGAFFTWHYVKRKARAEAAQAEVVASKEMQDMYQQMLHDKNDEVTDKNRIISELRDDRDKYKADCNELRLELEKVQRSLSEWKAESDARIRDLQDRVQRNVQQLSFMRPLLCGMRDCLLRKPVDIEPKNESDGNDAE